MCAAAVARVPVHLSFPPTTTTAVFVAPLILLITCCFCVTTFHTLLQGVHGDGLHTRSSSNLANTLRQNKQMGEEQSTAVVSRTNKNTSLIAPLGLSYYKQNSLLEAAKCNTNGNRCRKTLNFVPLRGDGYPRVRRSTAVAWLAATSLVAGCRLCSWAVSHAQGTPVQTCRKTFANPYFFLFLFPRGRGIPRGITALVFYFYVPPLVIVLEAAQRGRERRARPQMSEDQQSILSGELARVAQRDVLCCCLQSCSIFLGGGATAATDSV